MSRFPRGTGSRSFGIPVQAQFGEQLLHRHLPVQHFNFGGVVVKVEPFHGIELIRSFPQRCPEHTAMSRFSTRGITYGSPKPACTSPPT